MWGQRIAGFVALSTAVLLVALALLSPENLTTSSPLPMFGAALFAGCVGLVLVLEDDRFDDGSIMKVDPELGAIIFSKDRQRLEVPFKAIKQVTVYSYTVSSSSGMGQNQRTVSETRYGVQAVKQDGGTLTLDSGFSSHGEALAAAEGHQQVIKSALSAKPAKVEPGSLILSPYVRLDHQGSRHRWVWSIAPNALYFLYFLGVCGGQATVFSGLIQSGQGEAAFYFVIPLDILVLLGAVYYFFKDRGRCAALVMTADRLSYEELQGSNFEEMWTLKFEDLCACQYNGSELRFRLTEGRMPVCNKTESRHWFSAPLNDMPALDARVLEQVFDERIAKATGRDLAEV